jgi:hypothetical protein
VEFDLRPLRSDAALLVPKLLADFQPGAPRDVIVRTCDEIVLRFHILAVGALLVDGDAEKFFLHLSRCAENGLRILQLLARRALDRPPASRNVPLLAALAAGDFERGGEIARLSHDTRDRSAGEYEDEFLWARGVQLLAAPSLAPGRLGGILDQLIKIDARSYTDRAAAARAIEVGDQEAFENAIAGAALVYEMATERRAAAFGTPVTTFAPHRFLWLEGLALLRLGERAGLKVERELRFCPPLARVPMTGRYVGDLAIRIEDTTG